MKRLLALVLICLCLVVYGVDADDDFWDIRVMEQTLQVERGGRIGLAQEIRYAGVPYEGRPTQVFAYIAKPASGEGPFPAVVLMHGGAGKAYREWAELWARKGCIAIAMYLTGEVPTGKRLRQAGQEMNQANIFLPSENDAGLRNGWIYHAAAAVVRARSLLVDMPEMDQGRVGITGISWGGFITCLVAGMDHRYGAAVPVYGCGYICEGGFWKNTFRRMSPAYRERWIRLLEPSSVLARVKCPILFVNGNSDTHFPPENTSRSALLVDEALRHVTFIDKLRHGHNWKISEVDAFVNDVLTGKASLMRISRSVISGGEVIATVVGSYAAEDVFLYHAPRAVSWKEREWEKLPVKTDGREIRVSLSDCGDAVFYFSVKDDRGLESTSICRMVD
jgi:dienelactone hydrolase